MRGVSHPARQGCQVRGGLVRAVIPEITVNRALARQCEATREARRIAHRAVETLAKARDALAAGDANRAIELFREAETLAESAREAGVGIHLS